MLSAIKDGFWRQVAYLTGSKDSDSEDQLDYQKQNPQKEQDFTPTGDEFDQIYFERLNLVHKIEKA